MSEITVILKDNSRIYRQKFLSYLVFSVSPDEPYIQECIAEAVKCFGAEPDSIDVRIHLHIQ